MSLAASCLGCWAAHVAATELAAWVAKTEGVVCSRQRVQAVVVVAAGLEAVVTAAEAAEVAQMVRVAEAASRATVAVA